MFKISTKGDYGLLILAALAIKEKQGQKFVSLSEIAQEKHLSPRYLSQIILPLKKAGLVKSKEGIGGGYCLAKKPEKIKIIEILEVLEGPLAIVPCCAIKSQKCATKQCEKDCAAKSTWQQASALLAQFLANKTLKDIIA